MLWMLSASFKPLSEILQVPPTWIPKSPTLRNYVTVFQQMAFARYIANSVIVAAVTVVCVLLTSALGGYALSKFQFPGRDFIFIAILSTMMIPFQVRMIPLYVMVYQVGLVNTYAGLILPGAVDAFGIFMMRQYIQSLPNDLIDAARMDGASEPGIFWRIILPLCGPALSALAIFTFMWSWESFIWPLIVTNTEQMLTLPIGLSKFSGRYLTRYDLTMAAATVSIMPVLLVFLILQRRFIEGIALTGIKG
ncbi:MAG: carbohydrate ABC transporter permease [Anaerolineae bacterium]|nr:carbohydrate ABC transporter permease [Anaerolineae bacterium]